MHRTARVVDARFEYPDLVIPLCLRLEGAHYPSRRELAAFHGYDGLVVQHLGLAAQEGWYPDETADWGSLAAAGQFATEADPGLDESGEGATAYRSVTIRLKCPAVQG
jgi:hypothetical protein